MPCAQSRNQSGPQLLVIYFHQPHECASANFQRASNLSVQYLRCAHALLLQGVCHLLGSGILGISCILRDFTNSALTLSYRTSISRIGSVGTTGLHNVSAVVDHLTTSPLPCRIS